ncbi:MAG: electron transfer flavoprotein subunit beta/FixA family protein [candidate division Zixibacteria bacterium]|jgi:electron transfer flavoprotein beta subunit|nr:electron transfer flavoprotein subunit beta/FixA family protein [candidate division Zixibacteria bacterium]
MNIIVCVKQVPEIALIKVDEASGKVVYPQGPGVINPSDSYALEEALQIREKSGGKITAISVGGKETEVALKEALALGVDEAVCLDDPAFEGSDGQAIGFILSKGIEKIGEYDLVLCGKQAIDSDNAMVAPAVAENLGAAQAMFVRKVESYDSDKMVVQRTTEDGYDTCELAFPAVLSVVKELNEPRLPSLKGKMKAKKATIPHWSAADLGVDTAVTGASSPSSIDKAAKPPPRPQGEMITGETPEEIADKLFRKLRENQVI